MKLPYFIFIFLVFFFSIDGLKSQSFNNNFQVMPLKSNNSPLFGRDIIMNSQSVENQRNVAFCSAFNGWLYATYSYFDSINNEAAGTLLKSIDNGITWTVLWESDYFLLNSRFVTMDIVTTGDSISNLKVFIGIVVTDYIQDIGWCLVNRYSSNGEYEATIFQDPSASWVSLSNDFNYPAFNSNPRSLGVLYAKYGNLYSPDSLIFVSSSNGGISIDNHKVVAIGTNHFHKVGLAYGRSPSWSSGRYYAVWEEKTDLNSPAGHIYTAHTNPNFNSPFTTPVMLDGLDPSATNNAMNPSIACQYNNTDNDSSNLTEVVLFDKYIPSQNRYDIEGFYNKTATVSNNFTPFALNLSGDNRMQSSVAFNPYDETFMVTYYDSTTQKLPFLKNDFNISNANSWQYVSSGYNDDASLAAPWPKVALNMGQQEGANVWIKEGTGGNGVAMFDAPYSTYTRISGNNNGNNDRLLGVYPNPCRDVATIGVELKNPGNVKITLYDVYGQSVGVLTDRDFTSGKHNLKVDISNYPPGTYIYNLQTSAFPGSGKLVIVR
jgi:hypothetical protein